MELWDVLDEHRNRTGRTVERGQPMAQDEYHLVVHVWVVTPKGEFLISRRTPNKQFPGMWESTGGSAVAGEDSLTAAIREMQEELGICLAPSKGMLFRSYRNPDCDCPQFVDVWLFEQDVLLEDVTYQEGETDGAMLATQAQIEAMITEGRFLGRDIFQYLDELFAYVRSLVWVTT
jgi:8-oxo-dGTP diphosphatase